MEQIWTTLIGQLGISGVLAWFLHYVLTTALPAKDKLHAEERQQDREASRLARTEDRAEDSTLRKMLHAESLGAVTRLTGNIDKLTAHIENLTERMNSNPRGPRTMLRRLDDQPPPSTERNP
jgi:hypothetical protein